MEAAGDVGARDDGEHRLVVAHPPRPEGFAEVAVEVDHRLHAPILPKHRAHWDGEDGCGTRHAPEAGPTALAPMHPFGPICLVHGRPGARRRAPPSWRPRPRCASPLRMRRARARPQRTPLVAARHGHGDEPARRGAHAVGSPGRAAAVGRRRGGGPGTPGPVVDPPPADGRGARERARHRERGRGAGRRLAPGRGDGARGGPRRRGRAPRARLPCRATATGPITSTRTSPRHPTTASCGCRSRAHPAPSASARPRTC